VKTKLTAHSPVIHFMNVGHETVSYYSAKPVSSARLPCRLGQASTIVRCHTINISYDRPDLARRWY